jgi:hypothetical protein
MPASTTTRHRLTAIVLGAACALALAGCAPADVAGNYTIALTNQQNGCNLSNWTAGASTSGVAFVITQSGANVTGQVQGLTGAAIALWLGGDTFTGTVSGASVDMTLFGTRSMTQGACSYTLNAHVRGNLSGDSLQGTVTYSASTNHAPDCGALEGCSSVQQFDGVRPPSAH